MEPWVGIGVIVLKDEEVSHAGQLQDTLHIGGSAPKRQAPRRAPMRLDQQMDPGAVDEGQPGQIDDDSAGAPFGPTKSLLQGRARPEVELAAQEQSYGVPVGQQFDHQLARPRRVP
jgi:hypothetical protein